MPKLLWATAQAALAVWLLSSALNLLQCHISVFAPSLGLLCQKHTRLVAHQQELRYRMHIVGDTSYFRYRYLGCFADALEKRDLGNHWQSFTITPTMCLEKCFIMAYSYAGLQGGNECWCGDRKSSVARSENARKYTLLNDGKCKMPCTGDMHSFCGGVMANALYHIKDINVLGDSEHHTSTANITKPLAPVHLPASSLYCRQVNVQGSHILFTQTTNFIFLRENSSTVKFHNIPLINNPSEQMMDYQRLLTAPHGTSIGFLDLSPVHKIYYLTITVMDKHKLILEDNVPFNIVRTVTQPSFGFGRSMALNIMHVIHDDMMNIYFTLLKHFPLSNNDTDDRLHIFDTSIQIVLLDVYGSGPYMSLLQLLSARPILHLWDIVEPPVLELEEVKLLGKHPRIMSRAERRNQYIKKHNYRNDRNHSYVLFSNISIGLPPITSWYQYGYGEPQGPLPLKPEEITRVGQQIQYFSRFIRQHVSEDVNPPRLLPITQPCSSYVHISENASIHRNISLESISQEITSINHSANDSHRNFQQRTLSRVYRMSPIQFKNASIASQRLSRPGYVAIFSRSKNRRIVNEDQLMLAIEAAFPSLTAVIIRLEDMSLQTILHILTHSAIAIGMHGSILILAMFMPAGSLLIECFPYAVPADNYTPYKTMASLLNSSLKYAAWENKRIENNYSFPNRSKNEGGLQHLSPELRDEVMSSTTVPLHECCWDPFWLYRYYSISIFLCECPTLAYFGNFFWGMLNYTYCCMGTKRYQRTYQDTRVSTSDIVALIQKHLQTDALPLTPLHD